MPEYIERNKIAEMLNTTYYEGWIAKSSVEAYLDTVLRALAILPHVDVKEVRHGHWICHGDVGVTECSACHNSVEEYVEYPYCPFCGVKMDEEDKNGRS